MAKPMIRKCARKCERTDRHREFLPRSKPPKAEKPCDPRTEIDVTIAFEMEHRHAGH